MCVCILVCVHVYGKVRGQGVKLGVSYMHVRRTICVPD